MLRFAPSLALGLLSLSLGLACTPTPPRVDAGDGDGDGIGIPVFTFDGGSGGDGDGDVAGDGDGDGDGDADGGVLDAGPGQPGAVQVEAVTPPTGELGGGYRVRVEGQGFSPESRIFFDDIEANPELVLYQNVRALTCTVPPGMSAGPVTVRVEDPQGTGELEGAFTYFSPVTLFEIDPAVGATAGGTEVEVTGEGLHEEMIVLVDGRQAIDLVVAEDGLSATFLTPAGLAPGRVDVEAIDDFGRSTLELAFTYEDDLTLESVTPASVPFGESPILDVRGAGFSTETTFELGGEAAPVDNLISSDRVRLLLPGGQTGLQDLTATDGLQSATLEGAVYLFGAPTGGLVLDAVVPATGDVLGGTEVRLYGEGLGEQTSVTVGGAAAASVEVISDGELLIETPAGAAGPATVEVTTPDGTASAPFTYEVPLEVSGAAPAAGPVAGGVELTVTGRGFTAASTVRIGGVDAPATFVDDTALTVTAPPGSSGPADVEVRDGERTALLEGGFLYETDLQVLGVMPPRGGVSGGTYVEISGAGFSQGVADISFGLGVPVTEWEVLSDNVLAVYTPVNTTGVVDVTVSLDDGSEAVAEGAFTYFDPTFLVGGTRGGPIDGAVYVTALDTLTGLPVPDLVVFLGTNGGGEHMAITNLIGQATISGPDVVGAQTVSVVGDNYEYASLVDVNAAEITLYLQPLNLVAPPAQGELPPPPPPATIRGKVFGFAKEFFDPAALGPDEVALALVTTTARDEFSRIPNPGAENVVFTEGGEYFIANARPGRLAVVALAGIFNLTTEEFRMRQMGVRRNVYPQLGVDLEEIDVELTIPLDVEVDLSLPDAPVGIEDGPTITRVVPYLQFGGEGSLAYTTAIQTSRNHPLEGMPDVPGEMLTFIAGAYTTNESGLVTDQGLVTLIEGDKTALGSVTNWGEADPFTGVPLVNGAILVVERPDGGTWATEVLQAVDATTLLLADDPPFSGVDLGYHIGNPSYPRSEVVQDGVGSLIGGVTIQPVLGLPEPLAPLQNGVLGPERQLRWKAAPGQKPSMHQMYIYDPLEFSILWTFYIDGSRTKVPIPRIPAAVADLPLENLPGDMPAGGYAWQHTSMYLPTQGGFDYTNWSYLDIGSRARRAWTTDLHLFVYGGE